MGKFRNMITLKDPEPGNEQNGFGYSVAIHNGYVVVGNYNGESPDTGSVHVFKKSGMGFSYLQTLAAPDGVDGDLFGFSVAIHDGFIVVGAAIDNSNSGSVYVYRLDGGKFRHHQKIPNPDGSPEDDYFGYSVAIHDGYIVVGAFGDNNDSGSVYVYRLERGEFRLLQHIPNPESPEDDYFGWSVAIHDGYIVVGAYGDNSDSGSVYVYRLERGEFRLLQKIPNPDGNPGSDYFGYSVAIHDGFIVVGAPGDDGNSGSVYVYRLERGEFRLLQKIPNPESPDTDQFGWSVAIHDGFIVVGAYYDNDASGSVYVYRFERGEFKHHQKIQNPDKGSPDGDFFGNSVAIHDGRIVVGATQPIIESIPKTNKPGNAYVFSYGY